MNKKLILQPSNLSVLTQNKLTKKKSLTPKHNQQSRIRLLHQSIQKQNILQLNNNQYKKKYSIDKLKNIKSVPVTTYRQQSSQQKSKMLVTELQNDQELFYQDLYQNQYPSSLYPPNHYLHNLLSERYSKKTFSSLQSSLETIRKPKNLIKKKPSFILVLGDRKHPDNLSSKRPQKQINKKTIHRPKKPSKKDRNNSCNNLHSLNSSVQPSSPNFQNILTRVFTLFSHYHQQYQKSKQQKLSLTAELMFYKKKCQNQQNPKTVLKGNKIKIKNQNSKIPTLTTIASQYHSTQSKSGVAQNYKLLS